MWIKDSRMDAVAADKIWKALADSVRREILSLLRRAPRTTSALCEQFDHMSRFGVMNHVATLREAGLVRVEKRGRAKLNHFAAEHLEEVLAAWMKDGAGAERPAAEKVNIAGEAGVRAPSSLTYFAIDRQFTFEASPTAVFRALTDDIGEWWGSPYLRDDARDIVIDPCPGGLMKQVDPHGGGSVMCTVKELRRDRLLVLEGTMRMPGAIHGVIRFDVEPSRSGTLLTLRHDAFGEIRSSTAKSFITGWTELLDKRLRRLLEHGEATGIRAAQSSGKSITEGLRA
jgi:DNA-binding transcriptional ArsR family regulator/uncharacterized protein YndB with AHSA1/START domain